MDFRYKCKPSYPEGDLIRKEDLFWPQNNYDQPIIDMDHRIDKISEEVINRYLRKGLLVDIEDNDVHHLKNYARKHQYFE